MMATTLNVNDAAPLQNVAAFSVLIKKLVERRPGVDGMGLFFGDPGLGKSKSAIKGANIYRAAYVECGQFTTARSLLEDILVELGESYPKGRITDLIKKAVFRMAGNRARPLIVDEAHWIANKRFVDVLRELHDKSTAPVILIGEKTLPTRLQLFPQVKDRMLVEVEAVPCNESDFRLLHKMYCPAVPLAGDLVRAILDATRGNARRIVVNLVDAEEKASVLSPAELSDGLTLAQFGGDHAIARNTLNARRV